MPHESYWLVDKIVLYIGYTGVVEQNELALLSGILSKHLEEGEEPVHIVTDQSSMGKLNVDLKSLRSAFTIMQDQRWGWIMIVGADPITKFFGQVVSHAFRRKMRIVDNLDAAKYALSIEDQRLVNIFHLEGDTE